MGELSDEDVFGSAPSAVEPPKEMSDGDVFGAPTPQTPELPDLDTRRKQAAANAESQMSAANQAKPWYQKAAEGVPRGMEQALVGMTQSLEGSHMDPETKDTYQDLAKNLELQGKGSGVAGTVGEVAGQMTNPLNAVSLAAPEGILSRIATGAVMGAAQPQTQDNQTGANMATGAVLNAAIPPVVSGITKGIGNTIQGAANKAGLTNFIGNIAENLGANPTTSKLYQAAKSIGMDLKGKSPQEIKDNLQTAFTGATGDIKNIVSGGNELNPVAANAAISKNYDDAISQSQQLYGKVKELGEGKYADAGDLMDNVSSLVNELENKKTISPEEERGLNELKYWQNKITGAAQDEPSGEGNVVPLFNKENTPNQIAYNDVVDLKQALNQNFNPSKFPTRADAPFNKLAGNVNNVLDTIAKSTDETIKSPESDFSTALQTANDHWTDVSRTYKNDLINQFWTPNDYYESKALTDRGIPLSTTLRKRARGMVDSIQTPEDLEALTDALPIQAADAVKGAKFQQIMDKAGVDPTAIYENKDTLDRILRNNPEASKALDNITTIMDGLNQAGLGNNMTKQIDSEARRGGDEALRTVWSMATNHKLYALKHALNTISPAEKTAGKALKGFQKEVLSGSPLKQAVSAPVSKIAPGLGKAAGLAAINQIEQ